MLTHNPQIVLRVAAGGKASALGRVFVSVPPRRPHQNPGQAEAKGASDRRGVPASDASKCAESKASLSEIGRAHV